MKSRVTVKAKDWGKDMCLKVDPSIQLRTDTERGNYTSFVRLVNQIGARPVLLIQYDRESYLSRSDNYARVTFDRRIRYCPSRDWTLFPAHRHWFSMDTQTALNHPFPGIIFEMKTFSDCPGWMVDLTRRFDLVRVGFCKYFTALRLESLFTGSMYSDTSETCQYI